MSEQNVQGMQEALRRVTGKPAVVKVEYATGPAGARPQAQPPAQNQAAEKKKQLMTLPLFRKAAEALGAQIWHVDDDFNPAALPPKPAAPSDPEDEA